MPSATIVEIADAVVADLNAATLSQPLSAQRLYVPSFCAQDLAELKVVVVPRAEDGSTASRSATQHEYTIDVGLLKRVPNATPAEVDPLMLLTQEIGDYFRFRSPAGRTERWLRTEVRVPFSPEHMEQQRQFLAVLSIIFVGLRGA
ncbi:MAG: hypothetical protein AB7O62_05480 [Pirellulales bacterium]